jgi:hypothetical protein
MAERQRTKPERTFVRNARDKAKVATEGATKAFANTGPNNPLRKLSDPDKKYLWALLRAYEGVVSAKTEQSQRTDPLEEAARVAIDAALLATKMEAHIFTGPQAASFQPFLVGLEDLASRLKDFANTFQTLLALMGKPGHKQRVFVNRLLLTASEFVYSQFGTYQDEHLAELLQTLDRATEPSELSGDAIRKKRENMKKSYPEVYEHIITTVAAARSHAGAKI